jgi:hypothetical protein
LIGLLGFTHLECIRPVFADIAGLAFFPGSTGVLRGDWACRPLLHVGVLVLRHSATRRRGARRRNAAATKT